jgi:hypothetical protein
MFGGLCENVEFELDVRSSAHTGRTRGLPVQPASELATAASWVVPPPGWQPDPAWPPPPPGWRLWISDEDPTSAAPTSPIAVPASNLQKAGRDQTPTWQRPEAGGGPAAPARSVLGRLLQWFRRLPMWAKVLVILLVVGLLPWLLIAGGLAATAIGIVGLVRGPLPRFNVVSRASAIGALMLGLVALGGGGAMAVAVYSPPPPSGTTSSPSRFQQPNRRPQRLCHRPPRCHRQPAQQPRRRRPSHGPSPPLPSPERRRRRLDDPRFPRRLR